MPQEVPLPSRFDTGYSDRMATETPALPPYRQFLPNPRLRPYVLCFWAVHAPSLADGPRRIRVLPDGCMDVIFNFGEKLSPQGVPSTQPGAFIIGTSMRPGLVEMHGNIDITGFRLRPGGAAPLLGTHCSELAETIGPTELLGPEFSSLLRFHAGSEPDPFQRVEIMERLLLERLPRIPEANPVVASALEILRLGAHPDIRPTSKDSMETNSCAALAEALGIGRRTLERLFARQVGIAPVALRRTMRLHHALNLLRKKELSLTETALCAGFYDQAHFIKEIKALTGLTPLALRREWQDDAIVQYDTPDLW